MQPSSGWQMTGSAVSSGGAAKTKSVTADLDEEPLVRARRQDLKTAGERVVEQSLL